MVEILRAPKSLTFRWLKTNHVTLLYCPIAGCCRAIVEQGAVEGGSGGGSGSCSGSSGNGSSGSSCILLCFSGNCFLCFDAGGSGSSAAVDVPVAAAAVVELAVAAVVLAAAAAEMEAAAAVMGT